MINDLKTALTKDVIEADLIIVGTGPAGMSLALEFANTKHSVILIESGHFGAQKDVNDLNVGERTGQKYFPLDKCRTRYFGGSSNCWAGWCAPFSPADFESHDWLPNSGWPIEYKDIVPYYAKANKRLQLNSSGYAGQIWQSKAKPQLDLKPMLETHVFKFSKPTRFGKTYRKQLNKAPNINCLLNATVTQINLQPNGNSVESLTVTHSIDKRKVQIKGRRFVLAAGGIENPRLLLASNTVSNKGVGNQYDNVGRYFMEHPHLYAEGRFFNTNALKSLALYDRHKSKNQWIRGYLSVPSQLRKKENLLNMSMCITPLKKGRLGTEDTIVAQSASSFDTHTLLNKKGETVFCTDIRAEQAPNPASRVTLGTETDALGVPRASLNWQLTDLDHRSVESTQRLLGRALGARGLTRFKLMIDNRDRYNRRVQGGCHHMGTTRMHADPKLGVVDKNCKVFGVDNLYVAGSSVFTTSSAANPTLTIVAFAIRLAKWLKEELA